MPGVDAVRRVLDGIRRSVYRGPVRRALAGTGAADWIADRYWQVYMRGSPYHERQVADRHLRFRAETRQGLLALEHTIETEAPVLADLQARLEPADVFLDVGANVGVYTCLAASELDTEPIAVEPVPRNVEALRANLAANDLSATVHECALADRAGETAFDLSTAEEGETRGSIASDGAGPRITVDLERGDDLLAGGPDPTAVKIDVEGGELAALDGLREVLGAARLVYCEVHPELLDGDPAALEDGLADAGFALRRVTDRGSQYVLRGQA